MVENLPVEQRKEFQDLITKNLDNPSLGKSMKEGLIKHFTTEELKTLADFYSSPVGKSAMKKLGVYLAEIMNSIQEEMLKEHANANRELSGGTE